MSARPQLHLIDTSTGELLEDDRDFTLEELTKKYHGALGEIGKLKKQLREFRIVEPEAQVIRDVLEYCRERVGKPRQQIIEGGKRWEAVRARFNDKLEDRGPWTPAELQLAVDGALLDPWYNGTAPGAPKDGRYLDAATIFGNAERVEKFRDLALGFKAEAGVHLSDLLGVTDQLRYIDWKFQLRVCLCTHRRFEHSRGDPGREGREVCLAQGCNCPDFDMDSYDQFNQRVDPWLREHFGRNVA